MAVTTKKVSGRRMLRFETLDDVLDDAERLAAVPVKKLGNWTFGQILMHLSHAMNTSIDGAEFKASFLLKVAGRLLRNRMLRGPMPAGYQLPASAAAQLLPSGSATTEEGLAALRSAIERQHQIAERKPHAAFGAMTREQWNQLHLRHAELHLSFVVPT